MNYVKKYWKIVYFYVQEHPFAVTLLIISIYLSMFSVYALHPRIEGDSVSYFETMRVLQGHGDNQLLFAPYRFVTTFMALYSIMAFDLVVNSLAISWHIVNSILYVLFAVISYHLFYKVLESKRAAFISALLLATNYAVITSGLAYMMDIGGWTFYLLSLFYSFLYLERKETKWILSAAVSIGIGGLFKEYAYLASVVLAGVIVYSEWGRPAPIFKKGLYSLLIVFTPVVMVNIYSFYVYHYTYLDWFSNQPKYVYSSLFLEYVKSIGSLYNIGWFIFIPGAYLLGSSLKCIFKDRIILFICLVVLSSLGVVVWPVVTRVLFITMPATVMVSGLYIKKIEKKWYLLIPFMFMYAYVSFMMDAFILDHVNIQSMPGIFD